MIEIKTITRPTYNPFTDSCEDLIHVFQVHASKGKIDGVSLMSIITEGGVELMDWMKEEKTNEIEDAYFEEVSNG